MTSAASDRHLLSLPNLAFIGVTVGLFIVAFFIVDSTTGLALAIGGTAAAGTATWWFLTRRQRGSAPFVGVAVRGIATAAVLGILAISITGAQVFASWNSIGRDDYSLESAQQSLSGEASGVGTDTTTSTHAANGSATTTVPVLSGAFETVLLIGGDELSGNGDVILYLVYPTNGVEPFMMSFPRDLYIDNPCTGGKTRINVLARGCSQKGINGGTLMSVMVTELTGIEVDHFATFDFDGFEEIIDALGGIELCFDNAVRDSQSGLDLPAGCTDASGAEALSWV
ncbi:MAG: LCP family protein, partial [Acidimicrobiia bacterium]|nr:LCP family protein [Acidimicrobiia bacterium]